MRLLHLKVNFQWFKHLGIHSKVPPNIPLKTGSKSELLRFHSSLDINSILLKAWFRVNFFSRGWVRSQLYLLRHHATQTKLCIQIFILYYQPTKGESIVDVSYSHIIQLFRECFYEGLFTRLRCRTNLLAYILLFSIIWNI